MTSPTTIGSLLAFIENEWGLATPVSSAEVYFNEGWFDARKFRYPQVSVTDMIHPEQERFHQVDGSLRMRYRPLYLINIWQQIRTATPGTQELYNVESMRKEVARIFKDGFNQTPKWGGSLGNLRIALPADAGIPRHEYDKEPRVLRYELTLITTEDI